MKCILRIIVSPLILAILIVSAIRWVVICFLLFISNGGEWVSFQKGDKATIRELLNELKKKGLK